MISDSTAVHTLGPRSSGMKPRSKPWEDDYRIPNDTYANHYDLYLHPDLEAGTFSGKVTVHITALNPVQCIAKY